MKKIKVVKCIESYIPSKDEGLIYIKNPDYLPLLITAIPFVGTIAIIFYLLVKDVKYYTKK